MFTKLMRAVKKFRKKGRRAYQSGYRFPTSNIDHGTGSSLYMSDNATTAFATQWQDSEPRVYDTPQPVGSSNKERIKKKPVEVVKEIVAEEPKMNMADLRKQIKLVERRMRLLEEELDVNPTDEKEALMYLKARLKYKKYGKYFRWVITTNELLTKLTDKYELQNVSFSSYYKNVPMEAVDELESFLRCWKKVRKDTAPDIRLICDEGGTEQKKDPILLAESPFGKWWYILGAWDKEVEYIDDIVYHNK